MACNQKTFVTQTCYPTFRLKGLHIPTEGALPTARANEINFFSIIKLNVFTDLPFQMALDGIAERAASF